MKNPWKTLSSKEVYKNNWIRVREDKVIQPNGKEGIYGVIEIKPAVGIVAIDENNDIYLVGQWRYTQNKYSWEIPTGASNPNEPILESAKRELKEEAGITANKWISLGTIDNSNGVTNDSGYLFLALELTIGKNSPDDTEDIKIKKVKFTDAVEMVMKSEITESMSVSGILKAEKHLNKIKNQK
jgi:8-oxo-dGTP pyrophosphatase MutT (NUDIX family)